MRIYIAVSALILALTAPAFAAPANDPSAIIKDIYARIKASESYDPPNSVFTPRVQKLIKDDETDAKGEVGRLDTSIWVNAQDTVAIDKLIVTAKPDDFRKDRQTVTAQIVNKDYPETAVFYFEKQNSKWLIDDVRWTGKNGWVLSLILKWSDYGAGEQ